MKKIARLIFLILVCTFLAGGMSSCSLFDESTAHKQKSFKHKKPVPQKWVINNKSSKTLK
jgi:hypothetical protein